MKIAVFVSGNGSNLQAIIDAQKERKISSEVSLVISSNKEAYALQRATKAKIKTQIFDKKKYKDQKSCDEDIVQSLKQHHIDLVVLAGYMRIVSDELVDEYDNRIINIHPSLLPAFKGASAIKDSFEYGVKRTGVTVHFVDKQLDNGPIILQETVEVCGEETMDELEKKIHQAEHLLYPKAISLIEKNKLQIVGRKVLIV